GEGAYGGRGRSLEGERKGAASPVAAIARMGVAVPQCRGSGGHVMFPRIVKRRPILFSTALPYAEDYDLWCRLSRLGTVVCPQEIVYRYRRHSDSIRELSKIQQAACVAEARHACQSRHLRSKHAVEDARALAQFWTCDGEQPLERSATRVHAVFNELRCDFSSYVERRYGP